MSRELLVSRFGDRTWAALREDGSTVELRVEREDEPAGFGRIVKARVSKVLPGIQSAFVDIGTSRDAFLHVRDLILPGEGTDRPPAAEPEEEVREEEPTHPVPSRGARDTPIQDRLRPGRELLVQVARESFGSKGARVTCAITLPGRYLVFLPTARHRGVSRRISGVEERERLQRILAGLPDDGGYIVRTAGEGAGEEAFQADARMLLETWRRIVERAERAPAPSVLHRDLDLLLRLLRDARRSELDRVVVDDAGDFQRAREYLEPLDATLAAALELHGGLRTLFEVHGVDVEIHKALRPKVWLKSGGYLVIEPTEALVSIDVNTGRFVGHARLEDTILRTNLEASVEIARQIRLRDLGGIIVVDFIDMARPENRRRVLERFESELRRDRARTKVVGLGDLGLLLLTRRRTHRPVGAMLTRPCSACGGRGRIASPDAVAAEAVAEVRRITASLGDGPRLRLRARPPEARAVLMALRSRGSGPDRALLDHLTVEEDAGAEPGTFDLLVE